MNVTLQYVQGVFFSLDYTLREYRPTTWAFLLGPAGGNDICVTMAHFIGMVTLGYFLVSHHGICGTLGLI